MSKYHSMVSRRDFMKGLGLASAGIGAMAVAPAFHDLDEMASSSGPIHKWPWWVKEKEIDNPTVEIDWSKVSRWDSRHVLQCSWQGSKELDAWIDLRDGAGAAKKKVTERDDRKLQGLKSGDPWYDLRNLALSTGRWKATVNNADYFLGTKVPTPEERGITKWTGSAEDASLMVKVAAIMYGASDVAFIELDPATSRNLIFSYEFRDGKPYVFEDVDKAYETGEADVNGRPAKDGKRVIPNKTRWLVQYSFDESEEWLGRFGEEGGMRYQTGQHAQPCIQRFIKSLGYQAIGPMNYTNNMSENIGLAILGGTSELGRNNLSISPRFGAVQGQCASIITDLPLAPTKPIDAGIHRFCETCMKCAELCPGGALSRQGQGPSGEIVKEATWEGFGPAHRFTGRTEFEAKTPGVFRQQAGANETPFYKHWWYSVPDCFPGTYDICGSFGCCVSCPFSSGVKAGVHQLIRATSAATPLFNSFFRDMDDVFYGKEGRLRRDPAQMEAFWHDEVKLGRFGTDSTL